MNSKIMMICPDWIIHRENELTVLKFLRQIKRDVKYPWMTYYSELVSVSRTPEAIGWTGGDYFNSSLVNLNVTRSVSNYMSLCPFFIHQFCYVS